MTVTVTVTLRPLGTGDIPELARHLAAVEAVDKTGEHYSEADLAEEFANPDIEVGKDIVGAFDGDEIVGYFAVYPRSTSGDIQQKVHVEGSVRPDRRGEGLGGLLVEAMIARADEVHAEQHPDVPARFSLTGLSGNRAQEDLLASVGMVPERWNFVMRTQLGDGTAMPVPATLPEGLELRRFEPSVSAAMHNAHNEAFLDHPDFTPWTEVMWKQWVTESRNFRPELSFAVVDRAAPDRVVAYLQSNEFDAYFEATGRREAFVAKVGTVRDYRGRGLAGTLLRHALRAYREAGFDEASLDVDSENPTGALGIYQRAGFEVESRWSNYALTRRPLR
ncbi:MAG: GNAT family N-acetyltransferase [Nocardioidaceae bacterium]|nr:GNAT family N-acetyltransferase [Nocardioidaceae bacterium]